MPDPTKVSDHQIHPNLKKLLMPYTESRELSELLEIKKELNTLIKLLTPTHSSFITGQEAVNIFKRLKDNTHER